MSRSPSATAKRWKGLRNWKHVSKPWHGLHKPNVETWLLASGVLWLMTAAALIRAIERVAEAITVLGIFP